MAMPFDAMLNELIDQHLDDWVNYIAERFNLPRGAASPMDTDLATNLRADRLIRVHAAQPYGLHLELESSHALGLPERLLRYNVLARYSTGLPILSIVIMLRPQANPSDLSELFEVGTPGVLGHILFRYGVIRLWEEGFRRLLEVPGLIPLALLTNEASEDLAASIKTVVEVSKSEIPNHQDCLSLLNSAFVLCGLRYPQEQLIRLFEDLTVRLEDSVTYQYILDKGWQKGHQQGLQQGLQQGRELGRQDMLQQATEQTLDFGKSLLLSLGQARFGTADVNTISAIMAMNDLDRVKRLCCDILNYSSWNDLLKSQS